MKWWRFEGQIGGHLNSIIKPRPSSPITNFDHEQQNFAILVDCSSQTQLTYEEQAKLNVQIHFQPYHLGVHNNACSFSWAKSPAIPK